MIPSLTQMDANIGWSSPEQISFSTKNSKCLAEKFLIKYLRKLSLSVEFINGKKFYAGNLHTLLFYISSLKVLYMNSLIRAVPRKKKKIMTEAMSMKNL